MNSDVLLSLRALIMSMLHGRLFAAGLFHGYNYVQLRRKDMFGKVRKTRSGTVKILSQIDRGGLGPALL